MFRLLTAMLMLCAAAFPTLAQEVLVDRRVSVSRDTDFFGSDLQSIFDTTFDVCRAACLGEPRCRALTFNTRSNACFLKSEVRDQASYPGALSATVTERDASDLARAARRGEELRFLDQADLAAAGREAEELPVRHPNTGLSAVELLQSARAARAEGNTAAALRFTGMALAVTDDTDLWTEYARLALDIQTSDADQRRGFRERALPGAINAYLRAGAPAAQVAALSVIAEALERNGRGRAMIPALRLAQSLAPNDALAARLQDAVGKFGFRIADHSIDSDAASPRICAQFSEPLVQAGVDYAPFVQADAGGLAVQADGTQLCIDGVEHGARYRVTFREGLPAASGEVLDTSVVLNLYVRDRAPVARFDGRGYILPAGGPVSLPIVTVNLSEVDLALFRISERNIVRAIQDDMFGRPVPEFRQQTFATELAEEIWRGTGEVDRTLNRDVTTRLPLDGVADDLRSGVYALQARVPGADPYEHPPATQWFVVSDLGMTTLSGNDGLHAIVRALSNAAAVPEARLTLLSRANAVLARATTDAEGHALFAPGLVRGTGGAAPALLLVERGDDMAFLPLDDPEFDLSDRGVEGRAPADPLDVFLTTHRGAFRAGETVVATALLRDPGARAVPGVPLTAILRRPDGVEYSRHLSRGAGGGGHVFRMPTTNDVARGTWRLDVHADVDAPALASQTLLIEDFLPERLDADLTLPEGPLAPGVPVPLSVTARYLFGAPGAGLGVESEVRVRATSTLPDFPGFVFGRHDADTTEQTRYLDEVTTGADGTVAIPLELPEIDLAGRPGEAQVIVRVREGSGRPIEREVTRAIAPRGPMIGIRPGFDGVLAENAEARFELVAVQTDAPMPVRWTINRVETSFQWYALDGNWAWEPVTRRTRVAAGEATLGRDPVGIAAPVTWGAYELRVEGEGGASVASSLAFEAGWYTAATARDTPDTLELSLDRKSYRPGDVARLRLVPRAAGQALITVMSDRVIAMLAVEVDKGENVIEVPVTADWGPGAYVAASVLRPADADRAPARALGLAHASVDPGAARLSAAFAVPDHAEPRAPLEVVLDVDGLAPNETAWASIAAIDVGILNLTGFDSPDPSEHFFGQRKLGVAIRDVYGRLIDATAGDLGQVRSGGDASAGLGMQSPPPTETLLAIVEGPVEVGADGKARTTLDLPAFDGTLRLMAVVWSDTGVGEAEAEVLVLDPVVVTATLPRFLAPGDQSRLLLEVVHATGPAGAASIRVEADGVTLGTGDLPGQFTLGEGERQVFALPVSAGEVGDHTVRLAVTTPSGKVLERAYTLAVRLNDPEIQRTSRFTLAPGDTFTFDADVFAGLREGTGTATLTAGPLARFDSAGLLAALDRYPYGCTEQVASQALPLLYLEDVARAMGLGGRDAIRARVERAVTRLLRNQTASGSFGMWRPEPSGSPADFWLDAYVTDFLSRARAQGVAVPDTAFRNALDNLRNRVNYAPDFDEGGADIAYALHVLAREGAAAIGDLRYYADVKAEAFSSPLALAQLGTALASHGDPTRADALFRRAGRRLAAPGPEPSGADLTETDLPETPVRSDFGTPRRDSAAVLTLAVESGSTAVPRDALVDLAVPLQGGPERSTQEAVWTLLAAHALIGDAAGSGLSVDGRVPEGPLIRLREDDTDSAPVAIANTGTNDATLTLTTFGVPETPAPKGGDGYAIERTYFTLEGLPVAPETVRVGTRLVAVVTVQPFGATEARLMVNDPLPAGFEIDNPNLIRAGDIGPLDWLETVDEVEATEFRSDRMLAAVTWSSDRPFRLAYVVRAVSPGAFHHPAASVGDMYRPRFRANTATGRIVVTE